MAFDKTLADKITSNTEFLEKADQYCKNSGRLIILGLLTAKDDETANKEISKISMEQVVLGQALVAYAMKVIQVEQKLAVN